MIGCSKNSERVKNIDPVEMKARIINDPDFKEYIQTISLIKDKQESFTSNPFLDQEVSLNYQDERSFINDFKDAIANNDLQKKRKVASFLGFDNYQTFYLLREKANYSFQQLMKKYDFKQISKATWHNIVVESLKSNRSFTLVSGTSKNDECLDDLAACNDEALAVYSLEALGCVGWGSLGWTVIGGIAFLGCEGGALYHLKTMRRKCNTEYANCVKSVKH